MAQEAKWNAGLYDDKHSFVWKMAAGLLDLLAARPGERTLDVGCGTGLDMLNPSPEGTEIAVRISHADTTFTARGKVVFVFPNMGMGVMFTDVPASQQAILQKWLEELTAGGG